MAEYTFSDAELEEIRQNRDAKFGNWDWNYGKSPAYNIRRTIKFSSGLIDAYVNVVDSRIDNLKIYGDFFGIEDVAAVEEALIGLAYERDVVLAKLKELDLSRYFAGISAQEIAEAIVE